MIDSNLTELCKRTINFQIDQMQYLCEMKRYNDAESIYNEFREWIVDDTDHDIFYLDFLND